jgi:hypothetical protein
MRKVVLEIGIRASHTPSGVYSDEILGEYTLKRSGDFDHATVVGILNEGTELAKTVVTQQVECDARVQALKAKEEENAG